MDQTPDDLITPAQAAKLAKTTPQAIFDAIRRGRLRKYEQPVMTTFVSRSEVRRYKRTPGKPGPKPKEQST